MSIKINIFDPPMCCSSGICGPTIDPALIQINETVNKLKKEYPEVEITRHMFGRDVKAYQENPQILEYIKKQGTDKLPLAIANGEIIKVKGYPTYMELKKYLDEA